MTMAALCQSLNGSQEHCEVTHSLTQWAPLSRPSKVLPLPPMLDSTELTSNSCKQCSQTIFIALDVLELSLIKCKLSCLYLNKFNKFPFANTSKAS